MGDRAERETDDLGTYRQLQELDRLEDLLEEMVELGVTSAEQLRQRIDELHAQFDREMNE